MKYVYTFIILILLSTYTFSRKQDYALEEIMGKADSLYSLQKYPEALDYYVKGMRAAEAENNSSAYMICIGYIANIYEHYGDNHSGLDYLKKGYENAVKKGRKNLESCFLTNIVSGLCKIGNVEEAKRYYKILEKTPPVINKELWRYNVLYDKARISTCEGKYAEALAVHQKALDYAKTHELGSEMEMFQENEIALLYVKMKDFDKSLEWGNLCKERAVKENNPSLLINAYEVLSETYKGMGDSFNSEKFFALSKYVDDSLFNEKDFNAAKHKLREFENKQADTSIQSMKARYIAITAILLFIIVVFLIKYLRMKHSRKTLAAKSTEKKPETAPADTVSLDDTQIETLYQSIAEVMGNNDKIFNPDFSLAMLAEEVQSNTKYVSWVINNKYNKNFKALLNEYRVNEACKMLDDEEISKSYTIESIYKHIGYKNATSFIRVFKKNTGLNPLEYKNRNKDKQ